MRKSLVTLFMATVALGLTYAAAVGIAYRTPALQTCGEVTGTVDGTTVQGLDLCNESPLPIYLDSVVASASPLVEVEAVKSLRTETSVLMASSVAVAPDQHAHESAPVQHWRIDPYGDGIHDRSGLRIVWPHGAEMRGILSIHYQYLGWPMELTVPVRQSK
jgi:hypothetical protein